MKSFMFTFILFTVVVIDLTLAVPKGQAVFNNTQSGISGVMNLVPTMGYGTYLFGQIRNITCANSTSATLNPLQASVPNACRLGVTINNLANNFTQSTAFRVPAFNISTANLTNITNLLNSSRLGVMSLPLLGNLTAIPGIGSGAMTGNCQNFGNVFNPLGNLTSGPAGFLGNMKVNGGVGTMLLGPLDVLLSGPLSVLGLPLVLWMDAIQSLNNSILNTLNGGSNRMLGCATIIPTTGNYFFDDYN